MSRLPSTLQFALFLLLVASAVGGYVAGVTSGDIWKSAFVPVAIMALGSLLLLGRARRAFQDGLPVARAGYLDRVREGQTTRRWIALGAPLLAVLVGAAALVRDSNILMSGAGTLAGTSFLALSMISAFRVQPQS